MMKKIPAPKRKPKAAAQKSATEIYPNTVKLWRIHRGFKSPGALADKAGVTRPHLFRLEEHKGNYTPQMLAKLAKILDCSITDLIDVDPNNEPVIFRVYRALDGSKKKMAESFLQTLEQQK